MSSLSSWTWLSLLGAISVSLATQLHLWFQGWSGNRVRSGDVMSVLLGDSCRMFSNHFFVQADVSFHSGYYPSMFDQVDLPRNLHVAGNESPGDHAAHGEHGDHHDDMPEFIATPQNWIDRFGRNFYPTEHRHLEGAGEAKELLPWLLFSAKLDPHRIETYTVAAFWLRTELDKVDEAEQFLREGLRANPDSPEILYELGRIYYQHRQDSGRARNVWEAALRLWQTKFAGQPEPDHFLYAQILTHLARLEELSGHIDRAIHYFKLLQAVSPDPQQIQQQINNLLSAKE